MRRSGALAKSKKLLVCDVEGTIFKGRDGIEGIDHVSTVWQTLARRLGEGAVAQEKELAARWESGYYESYYQWVYDTFLFHRQFDLTRQLFDETINDAEYHHGASEFFHWLSSGLPQIEYVPVLVSGGFQELAERACDELDIRKEYAFGSCSYEFDDTGKLVSLGFLRESDFSNKMRCVKECCNREGLSENTDWLFIGDGKNDRYIAHRAPISISFSGHRELREVATFEIDNPDWLNIKERLSAIKDKAFHKKLEGNAYDQRKSAVPADTLNGIMNELVFSVGTCIREYIKARCPGNLDRLAKRSLHSYRDRYTDSFDLCDTLDLCRIIINKENREHFKDSRITKHVKELRDIRNIWAHLPASGDVDPYTLYQHFKAFSDLLATLEKLGFERASEVTDALVQHRANVYDPGNKRRGSYEYARVDERLVAG